MTQRFERLTKQLNIHVYVILELITDRASQIDRNSILEPYILHWADIPQIFLIVTVASCVAQPLDPLLAITALDDVHLVSDVNLPKFIVCENICVTYVDLHFFTAKV